jgi:hypothetical protein
MQRQGRQQNYLSTLRRRDVQITVETFDSYGNKKYEDCSSSMLAIYFMVSVLGVSLKLHCIY